MRTAAVALLLLVALCAVAAQDEGKYEYDGHLDWKDYEHGEHHHEYKYKHPHV